MKRRAVSVVGLGDDGCRGLSSRAFDAIASANVLVGGTRQLEFFPEFGGRKFAIKGSLESLLAELQALAEEHTVCVLASGDPLFFGIGTRVIAQMGAEHVDVIPHPSSVQWAFARAGMAWDDAEILSVHGRPLAGITAQLRMLSKVAILTDPDNNPSVIARHLLAHGVVEFEAWVCEHLCGPNERVRRFDLVELANNTDIATLNVLLLVRAASHARAASVIPYLPEDAFAKRMPKNGLITKREVRMLSLAALGLCERSVVWDVGAGSGSVGIEAALIARKGRVYAVETDAESVGIIADNVRALCADNVRVVHGLAPDALHDLETPDAVFIGGSKGSMQGIVDYALERLRPGGSLVANAITLENMHEAYAAVRACGLVPEVTLLQVSRAEPLARYMRFSALNPIQLVAVRKPITGALDA
jgi:precorrin-6Y C5,15-methyltransferase (decarboxylating)